MAICVLLEFPASKIWFVQVAVGTALRELLWDVSMTSQQKTCTIERANSCEGREADLIKEVSSSDDACGQRPPSF